MREAACQRAPAIRGFEPLAAHLLEHGPLVCVCWRRRRPVVGSLAPRLPGANSGETHFVSDASGVWWQVGNYHF
jgi:hypothetical protein